MVEDAAGTLQKEKTYAVARQFDAAYTILQNLECYALNNYVTYLNAQQSAFVQSMLHGFNNSFNEAEISIANIQKLKWQQAVCHEVGNSGLAYSTISVAKICCPVDVFVYDSSDELVFSIEDNAVTKTSRGISGSVANDIKVLAIPDAANYRVDIRATKDGAMTYLLDTYDAVNGTLVSSHIYTKVDITDGDSYIASFDGVPTLSESGTASEGGVIIEPTKHTETAGEKSKIISVQAETDTLTMEVGETAEVSAKVLPEDVYCPVLSWTSSDNNVVTVDEAGTVKAKKAGSAVLQCMAIDGSEASDTITVTVSDAECLHEHTALKDKSENRIRLRGSVSRVKANVSQGIPELIQIAINGRYSENRKKRHQKDAKYGWYRYDVRFALPVYNDQSGKIERYNIYFANMLVRHADDGKKYLYDFLGIKKETSSPLEP